MPNIDPGIGGRREYSEKQIGYFVFEALRFFPVFARTAFSSRDLFNSLSMVRTRERGIPKFLAIFSAETILSRIMAGCRIFKSYNGLDAN